MAKRNNLRIIDIERNDINGGSTRFYFSHNDSLYKEKKEKISNFLKVEKKTKLENSDTFKKFFQKILRLKTSLNKSIDRIIENKKIIHGYGASTKGNVLIQYYGLDSNYLDFISERNKQKFNCYTPGSKIKIVSEKYSREHKPDFYVVFPWHFKKEILLREKKIRKKGTKFIFPLPKVKII